MLASFHDHSAHGQRWDSAGLQINIIHKLVMKIAPVCSILLLHCAIIYVRQVSCSEGFHGVDDNADFAAAGPRNLVNEEFAKRASVDADARTIIAPAEFRGGRTEERTEGSNGGKGRPGILYDETNWCVDWSGQRDAATNRWNEPQTIIIRRQHWHTLIIQW